MKREERREREKRKREEKEKARRRERKKERKREREKEKERERERKRGQKEEREKRGSGKGGSLYRLLGLDTSALERLLLGLCDALEQSANPRTHQQGGLPIIFTQTHTYSSTHARAHTHTPVLGGIRGALSCLGALGSGPPARGACRWRRAAGRTSVSGTATATGRACGSTQRQTRRRGGGRGAPEERREREAPAARGGGVAVLVVAAAPDSWAAAGGPAGTPRPAAVAARPRSSPCPRARCRRMPRRPRTPAPPPTPVRLTRTTSAACSRFDLVPMWAHR
jgi:hypothetical protein